MLEFILKDDCPCDDFDYDYLVKIYDVEDTEGALNIIKDYIAFIKKYRDTFDDCLITYIKRFLSINFTNYDIQAIEDIKKIYY